MNTEALQKEKVMPAVSGKQYRLMQAIAHGRKKKTGKGAGPSPDVAQEFIRKTSKAKRKEYSRG